MAMRLLARSGSRGAQVGCSLAIGVLLSTLGGFFLYMVKTHPDDSSNDAVSLFAYVFGGVGVLMLLAAFHQLIALKTPETHVMVDADDFIPGASIRVRIIQPGPVRLKSLRANLVGTQSTYEWRTRSDNTSHRERTDRMIGTYNFFDQRDVSVIAGEEWQSEATLVIPADAPATVESGDLQMAWTIEVWGKVRWWADFMHPFEVKVTAAPSAAATSDRT
jgi:hypothetical protein